MAMAFSAQILRLSRGRIEVVNALRWERMPGSQRFFEMAVSLKSAVTK